MAPNQTTTGARPPVAEQGYSSYSPPGWGIFGTSVAGYVQEDEVADLRWPYSIPIYHRMRADSQVDALFKSVTLPLRRRRWVIDPNGASDEAVEKTASDFGLPVKGTDEVPQRGRHRFNHDDHLRHALLALGYGHMFFELYGEIDPDLNWRLRKLAPRMPQSIMRINVAKDGGLDGITQWGTSAARKNRTTLGLIGEPDPIPVSSLAAYVWDREGANWVGRSLFRPLYKHWLLADRIMRIDAMRHEKYGLGIPTGKAPKGANDKVITEYGEAMTALRANPDAGYGVPDGAGFSVEGVKGQLPDTILSIKMHHEAMARDFLAMFMQLGTTESGSRALGITFADFFALSVDAIAEWYCNITNEYVIEDMIDWNFGGDENAPLMAWEENKEEPIAVADFVQLINEGLIVVDEDLQAYARERWDLPAPGGAVIEQPNNIVPFPNLDANKTTEGVTEVGASSIRDRAHAHRNARASSQTYGAQPWRRSPNAVEAAAGTDFAAIQQEWEDGVASLVSDWTPIQSDQIDALVKAVRGAVATVNADALASLSAPVMGADVIGDHMMAVAEAAITGARAEALSQGVTIELVNVSEIESIIRSRASAVAALAARSLAQSAANQALMRYGVQGMSADDVADAVRTHLESLSDTFLTDTLGGALTQAQNTGRMTVFGKSPGRYYASELLDGNTCSYCEAIDGKEYDSLEAAESDYPAGGFAECAGGPRCRGTVVAIFEDEAGSAVPA